MSIYIGEVIKELRAKIGISQEELAHKSKLDRSYMGEIERNKKSPSYDTIVKISRGLGMDEVALAIEIKKYIDTNLWFENEPER